MTYPLIKELGLLPIEGELHHSKGTPYEARTQGALIRADDLERVLNQGVRVYGEKISSSGQIIWCKETDTHIICTSHTALLVDIRPIAPPQAELVLSLEEKLKLAKDLLQQFIDSGDIGSVGKYWEVQEAAQAFLYPDKAERVRDTAESLLKEIVDNLPGFWGALTDGPFGREFADRIARAKKLLESK
jgi:hypothetical protein